MTYCRRRKDDVRHGTKCLYRSPVRDQGIPVDLDRRASYILPGVHVVGKLVNRRDLVQWYQRDHYLAGFAESSTGTRNYRVRERN